MVFAMAVDAVVVDDEVGCDVVLGADCIGGGGVIARARLREIGFSCEGIC